MNKVFLFFLYLTSFFHMLSGISFSTDVSGNIETDTIWNLTGSPYVLTGNVQLLSGAGLTIEAGVVVKFNNNVWLNAEGNLSAIGNENQKITFTSNEINGTYYISFNENQDALSILDNCLIEKCTNIRNYGHELSIMRCKFYDNHAGFVFLSLYGEEQYSISDSEFFNNTFNGRLIQSGYNTTISNNSFYNNTINSTLSSTDYALIYAKSDVMITDNLIENNVATAISIDNMYSNTSILLPVGEISNNAIIKCGYPEGIGGAYGIVVNNVLDGNLNISNNIIKDNGGPGLYLYQYESVEIRNNLFKNNRSTRSSSIYLWNGSASWARIIEKNDIYGTVQLGGIDEDIYMQNNYWGTTDESVIDGRIYDYYDNTGLGKIIYKPFANEPFNIDTTAPHQMPWLMLLLDS